MPASRVTLTVRFDAEVDGVYCSPRCPHLVPCPRRGKESRQCAAFSAVVLTWSHSMGTKYYRATDCLEAEQAGKLPP